MITLYGFAISNYYNKVKLILLEKNIAFSEETVMTKSRDEAATYKVMELYADQAAVDHHMGTAYFQAAGQNLAPLVSAAPVIEVLDVIDEG